jgi:uncharacterized protein (TIGR04255 family)
MGDPLRNPPVYFTVAQVRFNPILKLADFLPSVQESFRHARFPDFVKHSTIAIKVNVQEGVTTPTPHQQERYAFGNAAKTHSFLLDECSLTLQSTDYGRFETFSEEFLKGLDRLHEIVQLDFLERVGVRYLDRVVPLAANDTLAQYLAPEALGLSTRLPGSAVHSFCETLTEVQGMKLLSRVVMLTGPVAFPPDLLPLGLEVAKRFQSQHGPHAVLDNDGFVDGREPYSVDTVRTHLHTIHEVIRAAFRAIATPYAFKVWNQ